MSALTNEQTAIRDVTREFVRKDVAPFADARFTDSAAKGAFISRLASEGAVTDYLLRLRRIVIPIMLPNALPGLANLWLILIKDTALISVVGFTELLYTAKQAAGSTRHYFLFYCAVGAIYLAMTLGSNVLFRLAERRLRRGIPVAA